MPSDHLVPRRRFLALVPALVAAAVPALAADLARSLAELARRTAEYRESLERLLVLREQEAARTEATAARYRDLADRGLVARREAEAAAAAADGARRRVEETRARIAEAGQAQAEIEAQALLAALPPVAPGEERATGGVVEYRGAVPFTLAQVAGLQRFFAGRFGRALPISALGQTAVHDRLGFDHRNAVDVALHPDSAEGRALLGHLRARGVPFLTFRGAVPGASTGAHIHVGPPSARRG